jgi:hypothetical protein
MTLGDNRLGGGGITVTATIRMKKDIFENRVYDLAVDVKISSSKLE